MKTTVIRALMSAIQARANCAKSGNTEWYEKHSECISRLSDDFLPSGSGIDNGTSIDLDKSGPGRLVLTTSYHHMDEWGSYDGWTEHDVIVTPDWEGVNIRITGRDRNQIKEYLGDVFQVCLTEEIDWDDAAGRYRPVRSSQSA